MKKWWKKQNPAIKSACIVGILGLCSATIISIFGLYSTFSRMLFDYYSGDNIPQVNISSLRANDTELLYGKTQNLDYIILFTNTCLETEWLRGHLIEPQTEISEIFLLIIESNLPFAITDIKFRITSYEPVDGLVIPHRKPLLGGGGFGEWVVIGRLDQVTVAPNKGVYSTMPGRVYQIRKDTASAFVLPVIFGSSGTYTYEFVLETNKFQTYFERQTVGDTLSYMYLPDIKIDEIIIDDPSEYYDEISYCNQ